MPYNSFSGSLMPSRCTTAHFLAAVLGLLALAASCPADETGWIDLSSGPKAFEAWQGPTGDWFLADNVEMDAKNPKLLVGKPGLGILINGPKGRTRNLLTRQKFTDLEMHAEFLIPKGSNSGIKLMGLYEIQIFDSYGVKQPTGADCGGVYPRAEDKPKYHHIDNGTPPAVNAAKPPGEWQSFAIVFQAPRFDADGKKTANARFVKVVHNDKVIHENVEVAYPTGSAWRLSKEVAKGPL